jgi:hypothetical protein
MSTETLRQTTEPGTEKLHIDEFVLDADDWYIAQRAFEAGEDPADFVRRVKAAREEQGRQQRMLRERQGDTGGQLPAAPVAPKLGSALRFPPGRAGRIAQYIYGQSYSPVKEVAIVATLGLLAGVCGRAYRTHTGIDLALFLILVARSGIGKDSAHQLIPKMLKLSGAPMAERFVRAQDYVSGEALHKDLLKAPGFLALQGEFGRKLKRMSNDRDTPMQALRTVMTNTYAKSFLEGKSYSDSEKTLLGVDWPALSFLGETTPGTFLECLTQDMMADGFMSRFLTVTYDGDRPYPNYHRDNALDDDDAAAWRDLVGHMVRYQTPFMEKTRTVEVTEDALERLVRFEITCIQSLNGTENEAERQVWNRAHLKALKVASLLAVADDYLNPCVTLQHACWATSLINADIDTFRSHRLSGNIGTGDDTREQKLIAILSDYLRNPLTDSFKDKRALKENGIVPRVYLQRRTSSLKAFCDHKLGANRSLDDALRSLVDNGVLQEMKRHDLIDKHGFHGRAFRILELPPSN